MGRGVVDSQFCAKGEDAGFVYLVFQRISTSRPENR